MARVRCAQGRDSSAWSEFKVGRSGSKVRRRQTIEDLVLVLLAVGNCGRVLRRAEQRHQEAQCSVWVVGLKGLSPAGHWVRAVPALQAKAGTPRRPQAGQACLSSAGTELRGEQ